MHDAAFSSFHDKVHRPSGISVWKVEVIGLLLFGSKELN
jgi:hypothetical protein